MLIERLPLHLGVNLKDGAEQSFCLVQTLTSALSVFGIVHVNMCLSGYVVLGEFSCFFVLEELND